MQTKNQKAFTMVELIFVIIIIGILAAVAIPRFGESANQAHLSKAKNAVAIIQSAVTTERQKMILRGEADTNITSLEGASSATLFNDINGDTGNPALSNGVTSCSGQYCWRKGNNTGDYIYKSGDGTEVTFSLNNNRFTCVPGTTPSGKLCKYLTK